MFLALLPILLEALAIAPATLWQLACVFNAAVIALLSITVCVARRRMAGADQGFSQVIFVTSMILGGGVVAGAILGAAGVVPARGAHYLGLFFLIYQMFMIFYRMLLMADDAARLASRRG